MWHSNVIGCNPKVKSLHTVTPLNTIIINECRLGSYIYNYVYIYIYIYVCVCVCVCV